MRTSHSLVYSGILITLTMIIAMPASTFALDNLTGDIETKLDSWREIAEKVGEDRRRVVEQLPTPTVPEQVRDTITPQLRDTASGVQQAVEPPQSTPAPTATSEPQTSPSPTRTAKPLKGERLSACQRREPAIRSIMATTTARSERQLIVFTQIAERTKKFYEQRGHKAQDYDALIQEVAMRRVLVEDAVEATKQAGHTFQCEGDHPKADIVSFTDQIHLQQQLMNDYRISIKNLIQAVRSVQPDAKEKSTSKEVYS